MNCFNCACCSLDVVLPKLGKLTLRSMVQASLLQLPAPQWGELFKSAFRNHVVATAAWQRREGFCKYAPVFGLLQSFSLCVCVAGVGGGDIYSSSQGAHRGQCACTCKSISMGCIVSSCIWFLALARRYTQQMTRMSETCLFSRRSPTVDLVYRWTC